MDIILERNIILEELIQLNSYIFMIRFNSNSIELEQMLQDKKDEYDVNFKEIYEKIEELRKDVRISMRELTERDYNRWNLLDLILLNLEKSAQLIQLSMFSPIENFNNLNRILSNMSIA
jgi:hypothetical protein